MSKKEKRNIALVFMGVFFMLSLIQSYQWYFGASDTAFLSQVIENIATRAKPVTQVNCTANEAELTWGEKADKVCSGFYDNRKEIEINQFKRHAYFILYLIAPLNWLLPIDILLPSLMVLSFLILLLFSYLLLRKNGVSIMQSSLFVLLVSCHPSWSEAIFGQPYVDRLFLCTGTLFLYFIAQEKRNWILILLSGILSCLIIERVAFVLGVFSIGYGVLWNQNKVKDRWKFLGLGLIFMIYGISLYKFFITQTAHTYLGYYSNLFFVDSIMNQKLWVFFFYNLIVVGIFAFFEWRALILAIGVMLPNIFGSIGGAEKNGWGTHYHSQYFPILIWAVALGYIKLNQLIPSQKKWALNATVSMLILLCASTASLYLPNVPLFSAKSFQKNVWVKSLMRLTDFAIKGNKSELKARKNLFLSIRKIIPEKDSIMTFNSFFPGLYQGREIYFYPMGINYSQYAVLEYKIEKDGHYVYFGATNFNGPDEQKKLDSCLNNRLKMEGWNTDSPIIMNKTVAILKREIKKGS